MYIHVRRSISKLPQLAVWYRTKKRQEKIPILLLKTILLIRMNSKILSTTTKKKSNRKNMTIVNLSGTMLRPGLNLT